MDNNAPAAVKKGGERGRERGGKKEAMVVEDASKSRTLVGMMLARTARRRTMARPTHKRGQYTIYKKIMLIVRQAFMCIKTRRQSENPDDLPLDNVALDMNANTKARLNHLSNEASNDFIFTFEAIAGQIQYGKDDPVVLPERAQKKDARVHFVIEQVDVWNSFNLSDKSHK